MVNHCLQECLVITYVGSLITMTFLYAMVSFFFCSAYISVFNPLEITRRLNKLLSQEIRGS